MLIGVFFFCSGMQITEALKLQMEVQKRLHEQLEACVSLSVSIKLLDPISLESLSIPIVVSFRLC